jgi:3-methyl-2-oxobutanoate hydroxymethyltransferase
VLECVPSEVARFVTENISIPTIGIGAGSATSGQVLVFQDLLGLNTEFKPRFVRKFLNGAELFREAIDKFDREVKSLEFPLEKESY